jgi:hypothetical protein
VCDARSEVPFPGTFAAAHRIADDNVIADESQWTTEEPVYRTELERETWQEIRQEIAHAYHFSDTQMAHYERQINNFPELEPVYSDFLRRLQRTIAAAPLPQTRSNGLYPQPGRYCVRGRHAQTDPVGSHGYSCQIMSSRHTGLSMVTSFTTHKSFG